MKVEQVYYDARTGESGRRIVDAPDVLNDEEAKAFHAAEEAKQTEFDRMFALREKLIEAAATGEAASTQERTEYIGLRDKYRGS